MKKILTFFYFLILFLNISYAQSEERITVNTLIKEGYKLITEETISSYDTLVFNKVFTLIKKNKIMVCTTRFNSSGSMKSIKCREP